MFWAQVWLQDIHLWLLGMISRFQYLCSEADVHSLIQVSSSASSPCSVCWCTGYAASGLSDGNASTQCSDMTWILVSMQQSTIFLKVGNILVSLWKSTRNQHVFSSCLYLCSGRNYFGAEVLHRVALEDSTGGAGIILVLNN